MTIYLSIKEAGGQLPERKTILERVPMYQATIYCLSLFFLALCPAKQIERPSQYGSQLSVMTWNIRNGNHDKGTYAWGKRKNRLLKQLKLANPMVLGLQEALHYQVLFLQQYGQQIKNVSATAEPVQDEHNAILYDANQLSCENTGVFWLSKTPDKPSRSWGSQYQRFCRWACFAHKKTGKIFYVFNVHFSHVSFLSRCKSAELILNRVKKIAKNSPAILLGDFNEGNNEQPIEIITKEYVSVFEYCYPKSKPTTFNGFERYYFLLEPKKIDYIFVRLQALAIREAQIIKNESFGEFASDHFPVVAILSLE